MPSMSGWVLRLDYIHNCQVIHCTFLCPRSRAGSCDAAVPQDPRRTPPRFYALDVGLDVATAQVIPPVVFLVFQFLCPRCRAGCCDTPRRSLTSSKAHPSFNALDVGLGLATRRVHQRGPRGVSVSMPWMSGWGVATRLVLVLVRLFSFLDWFLSVATGCCCCYPTAMAMGGGRPRAGMVRRGRPRRSRRSGRWRRC
jgi:hypothetical protein